MNCLKLRGRGAMSRLVEKEQGGKGAVERVTPRRPVSPAPLLLLSPAFTP